MLHFYDPTLGRFVQPDTVVPDGVQGYDRYAYANNSPVVYSDPSGHCPICAVAILAAIMATVLTADTPQPELINTHPAYGDGWPDAKYTSYGMTVSTGTILGEKRSITWAGSVDIVDTSKQTGVFLSQYVPNGATDARYSAPPKGFLSPQISFTKSQGLIWSDSIAQDVANYAGPSELKVLGVGPATLESFQSVDPTAGKPDGKVQGYAVGAGLSAPDVSYGDYFVKSKPFLIANKTSWK